jgi:hypothetical protein
MIINCIGICVTKEIEPVKGLVTEKRKGKTFVGVPYQGAFPLETIKEVLIEKGVPAESIGRTYMFMADI